jgi:hypothetical protein
MTNLPFSRLTTLCHREGGRQRRPREEEEEEEEEERGEDGGCARDAE